MYYVNNLLVPLHSASSVAYWISSARGTFRHGFLAAVGKVVSDSHLRLSLTTVHQLYTLHATLAEVTKAN